MQNHNIVFVVGLGPGGARFLTAQARSALQQAEVLCGYTVYLDLVRPLFPEKETYSTGMTKELDRCRWALETARAGRAVALVCSGDAGVYGMASPLLELAQGYPDVTVEVVPGLTAALSGGAVLGAPLPTISASSLFRTGSPRGKLSRRGWPVPPGAILRWHSITPLPRAARITCKKRSAFYWPTGKRRRRSAASSATLAGRGRKNVS